MKAAVNKDYGPAEKVVHIAEVARPEINDEEVLVQVYATSVSTGAWRMVEMNAGGVLQIPARMIFGLFRPRNPIQGGSFSGRVVAVGASVTRFKMGDEVFGVVGAGAHAEYIAIAEDKTIVKKPETLGYGEAAALPFGGLSALVFLRDFAKVQSGQKVLVTGASGGVGVFGVQIAKHLGAEVTALTSTDNVELVRSLGADHIIDYKRVDFTRGKETYDVIFDTAGVSSFREAARVLSPGGLFVPLEFGVPDILRSMRTDPQGRRIVIGVNGDSAADLAVLADLVESGVVRSVIDSIEPLTGIADAYRRVSERHKVGAVVVNVAMPLPVRAAA
ncbi:NAD(P)-dependent alcohol dehydrogenase [Devosia sp. BSSL-BM10]|uniref:NAD(P)-dependent alcohol dehydrogenase n=1 Tax=Devosia litorisediminis TaxID=2829817 RepID=A0A942I650_9HYPH|nr:NAD(P)-dependent alcohol dehydrogenase [Devosia litorisediminis]MBS3848483.1 NAD(P)-dependent alcohol dehydrogenase [Devosia litorisediminis]